MSLFTKEEQIIIAKKAKDFAEQISMNVAQLIIGKSCYVKGYTDAVERMKPTNIQDNKALLLQNVSFSLICVDTKHYTNITKDKKYNEFKNPNCKYNSRRFIYVKNDKGKPKAYYKTCFKQIYES